MLRLVACLIIVGCAGQPPENQPGGGGDDNSGDGTTPPLGQRLGGKTLDYVSGAPIAASTVTTDGIDPALSATSGSDGAWTIAGVPLGAEVTLSVGHAGYRTTRNGAIAIAGDVLTDVFEIAESDVIDLYTAAAATPVDRTAILIIELRDDNDVALEGIPLSNVKLLDDTGAAVASTQTLFMNETDVDPSLATATAFSGRSRVAILDVPEGGYTLKVNFTTPTNTPLTASTRIKAAAGGAVVAISKP